MKSVALHNLGCKVNAYEMDVMQQNLQEKGYEIVPFDTAADIYIINTCTVTNIADRKSRQMLHRAKKKNPGAVVVAVGCYAQTGAEKLAEDKTVDLVIGNNQKKDLAEILEKFLADRSYKNQIPDLKGPVPYEEMTLKKTAAHTRAYLKIQDGCNQFCSYCIIPYARGRVRSRRPKDALLEAEALAGEGYREIVVTGIHLSSYGLDFVNGQKGDHPKDIREEAYRQGHLLRLLEGLQQIQGIRRIRLGSLEPRIVTREFAEALRGMDKVCPHFHLSLQSGCDATLKRMNRHYLAGEYYERVELLREIYQDPAITADVIVGFPGETEEEFEETRRFLEKARLYEMHIFKYSRRQGTAAARMPDQLPERVKAKRSGILQELEREQSKAYRGKFLKKELEILLEEPVAIDGKTYMTGHTREYVKAAFPTPENLANRIIKKKAAGFLQENLLLVE